MTRKLIFVNGENFVFCDEICSKCPIKFVCFTSKETAFKVKINKRTKKLVSVVPYDETTEEHL